MRQFDIVYADPPWKQQKGGTRKVRPRQGRQLDYRTLSIHDIEMILSEYDASTMFLWTIDKFLHKAESIIDSLGYRLHARIVWDKGNGPAPAFTLRFTKEYLLWAYKRPMMKIAQDMRGKYTDVLREAPRGHSRKPEKAYLMIEHLYPDASKIELFARQRRQGWDAFGDQL